VWGLLLKLKDRGYRTGIVHLTVGDIGSRGTPEVRRQELMAAANALRLDHVEVLDFQDCRVTDDFPSRLKIAAVVRRYAPPWCSLHTGCVMGLYVPEVICPGIHSTDLTD
jgi:N-acetylglucosamine malate deacetylase 1